MPDVLVPVPAATGVDAKMRCAARSMPSVFVCIYVNQRLQKGSEGGACSAPRMICPLRSFCRACIFGGFR